MGLSLKEVKKLIAKPRHRGAIDEAIKFEKRIRLHTENIISEEYLPDSFNWFKTWVKEILPEDKYKTFFNLITLPIPTIEFTDAIFSELRKVFDGQDALRNDKFSSPELEQDAHLYFEENYKDFFESVVWNKSKTAINSVLVIDIKISDDDEYEPYYYFVDIEDVHDIDTERDGSCRYLMYRKKIKKGRREPFEAICEVDDQYYRILDVSDGLENAKLVSETEHNLGMTPARQIWTENLNSDSNIIKRSPLSGSLGQLDLLLFKEVSKTYSDLYSEYPILAHIEQGCDYTDAAGNVCENGYINYEVNGSPFTKECPTCAGKNFMGPGSNVIVPAPEEGESEIRVPAQFITVDPKILERVELSIQSLKDNIWGDTVGVGGDLMGNQAINTKQVDATQESKRSNILKIKFNLEIIEKFFRTVVNRIRYGEDYVSSDVDYGTEFFIRSISDLEQELKIAKENGVSEGELKEIQREIIKTKYKNNPEAQERLLVMLNLEPFPLLSRQEVVQMRKDNLITEDDFIKKVYFGEFVNRFERENAPLNMFGELKGFNEKIRIINQIIDEYVRTKTNDSSEPQAGD